MKGFSFIKKLLFLFIMVVGIVSLSSYSTYMDYSIDDSISSTDSPQQDPPTTLASGSSAGYDLGSVKPFIMNHQGNTLGTYYAYIGSNGYLYTGGFQWGGGSTAYVQSGAGTGIVDYDMSWFYGIVVNSSGTVKVSSYGTESSRTWSNVTVGGSTTNAVAVSMGNSCQMALTNTDVLYTSTNGATTMTSIVSSAATSASRGGIVDFVSGYTYQFVLYGNGDLYRGSHGALEASMTKVASNVLMFDYELSRTSDVNSKVIIYNSSNQIQYGTAGSVSSTDSTTWTTLVTVADVVQIRLATNLEAGYSAGWGYLTSDGTFKYNATAPTGTASSTITGVDYFDNTGYGQWGYLKDGKMYFWKVINNYITTNTSATTAFTGTNATNNNFSIEDLAGTDRDLQNTPPA